MWLAVFCEMQIDTWDDSVGACVSGISYFAVAVAAPGEMLGSGSSGDLKVLANGAPF